jgi:TrmH family RNA methyltransferase
MERIASRHNPIVKRFREVARSGSSAGAMLLDGEHLLEEALAAGVPIEVAAFADRPGNDALTRLAARSARAGARTVQVTDQVLAAMSPVKNPSGVVALATLRRAEASALLTGPEALVLLLHEIQDPGNVGAVIRVSEACGVTGVVTSEGSADPFGWTALRGAMGSTFRMPILDRQPLNDAIERARAAGIRVFATVPTGGTSLPHADLRGPSAVLLGGEGPGLPDALADTADERLTIPMRPPVESLNVATAAALIVYEAARQRSAT